METDLPGRPSILAEGGDLMRRLLVLVTTLVTLSLILTACGGRSAGPKPPTNAADVTGPIVQIAADSQGRPRVLVGEPPEPGIDGVAWVTVTSKTVILRAKGNGYEAVEPSDLKVGTTVEVWWDGLVQQSMPMQGAGLFVLVKGEG